MTINLKSRVSDYQVEVNCIVLSKLTNNIPVTPVNPSHLIIPNIELADPSFAIPQKIDIIIGAGLFYEIMCKEQQRPSITGPIYQKTRLGWEVSRQVNNKNKGNKNCIALFSSRVQINKNLEEQMSKFWRLEECGSNQNYSLEEKTCKNYFENTTTRDSTGRFTVQLPFRDNFKLGNSYDNALQRFLSLEKRFKSNLQLKENYKNFLKVYIDLNHMELVDIKINNKKNNTNYLNHAVINDNSLTTKLRVVLDGSCKTSTGIRLNDTLLKGPNIQQDLVCILARFRTHYYALCADISKMYRQILVNVKDRKYQRIIWREEPDKPIQIFQLKTVTYGTTPASFLSTGCLN